jgi:hypothetical protein
MVLGCEGPNLTIDTYIDRWHLYNISNIINYRNQKVFKFLMSDGGEICINSYVFISLFYPIQLRQN